MPKATRITRRSFSPHLYFSRFQFLLDHYQPGVILDLGNIGGVHGHGTSYSSHLAFSSRLSSTDQLVGLDLFPPNKPKDYLQQIQADITHPLPFRDYTFDTIYMGEIIEHLPNPSAILQEIRRLLKPQGVLIIDTPNPMSIESLGLYLIKRIEDLGDPTHHIMFTPASLVSLLTHNGFTITTLTCKHPRWHRYLPPSSITGLGSHLLVACHKS